MLTHPPRRNPEMQLTSFVDVLFNTLAFILVVGSLERATPSRLKVELPRPRLTAAAADRVAELAVVLDQMGRLQVEGMIVDDREFVRLLRRRPAAGKAVVIWADRRLPYERVIEVLALVQGGGSEGRVRLAVLPRR